MVTGLKSLVNNEWVAPQTFRIFLRGNLEQFHSTWVLWNRDLPAWWGPLIGLAFAAGVVQHPRLRRLVVSLVAWTVLLFVARRYVPFTRTWLFFLPLFFTVVSVSIARLTHRRRLALEIGAVILAVSLSIPVWWNRSPLSSVETGVLPDAASIAAFLSERNIPSESVLRNTDYDLPLQYYLWRRSGVRPARPSREAAEKVAANGIWILLNPAIGDSPDQIARQYGFSDIRIVEDWRFTKAHLVRCTI
jgi:hypothetical protein